MNFAKNLLKKYGWEEGQGLGKNSDGIVKPLKASLKFDNAGFGLDKAKEFNNHWWERVFNEAAGNININKDEEDVSFEVDDDEGVEISTKDYSVKKLKKLKGEQKHENFLQTSILNGPANVEEIPNKVKTDDLKFTQHKTLTDEELFAACGGRTAHKGARHGLNMKGKLARIEEQEKELLLKMNKTNGQEFLGQKVNNTEDWKLITNRKKKRKKSMNNSHDDCMSSSSSSSLDQNEKKMKLENNNEIFKDYELNNILYTTEYSSKTSKKKKKKDKKIEENLVKCMIAAKVSDEVKETTKFKINEEKNEEESNVKQKKKKRKRKHKNKEQEVKNLPNEGNYKTTTIGNYVEEINFENDTKIDEDIHNNRMDNIHAGKSKKEKKKSTKIDHIDEKSKKISKIEKKKLKKSVKKISKEIEKSLSLV